MAKLNKVKITEDEAGIFEDLCMRRHAARSMLAEAEKKYYEWWDSIVKRYKLNKNKNHNCNSKKRIVREMDTDLELNT